MGHLNNPDQPYNPNHYVQESKSLLGRKNEKLKPVKNLKDKEQSQMVIVNQPSELDYGLNKQSGKNSNRKIIKFPVSTDRIEDMGGKRADGGSPTSPTQALTPII